MSPVLRFVPQVIVVTAPNSGASDVFATTPVATKFLVSFGLNAIVTVIFLVALASVFGS